ncbi:MAG: hypothetical protein [Malazfec virus 1]
MLPVRTSLQIILITYLNIFLQHQLFVFLYGSQSQHTVPILFYISLIVGGLHMALYQALSIGVENCQTTDLQNSLIFLSALHSSSPFTSVYGNLEIVTITIYVKLFPSSQKLCKKCVKIYVKRGVIYTPLYFLTFLLSIPS